MRPCEIESCSNEAWAKGLCHKHYKRKGRHGSPTAGRPENGTNAAWLRSHGSWAEDACLTWPFSRNKEGYGLYSLSHTRTTRAHRMMCRLAHGEPPPDRPMAIHSCGKGHEGCVNPGHLRWGSAKDNTADALRHGTVVRGSASPRAKLSESQVAAIRALKGQTSQKALARTYGVDQSTISQILSGKRWGWAAAA